MTKKRETPPDVASVNPRYEGMTLGGMARLLTRPKNPAPRATLDRLQSDERDHATAQARTRGSRDARRSTHA